MNATIMARKIRVDTNLRCDYDNGIIPIGKFATQVKDGKAQGIFHGRLCHDAALAVREKLEQDDVDL